MKRKKKLISGLWSKMERRTFSSYVDANTLAIAGFNWWETSTLINTFNGLASVRIGSAENKSIVIIEDIRRTKTRKRTDWYFGVFDLTEEVKSPNFRYIEKLVTRKNRVAGRDLNMKILQAIEPILDSE